MDETTINREQQLDQALYGLPLIPLPDGFTDRVMAQIEQQPDLESIHFRLDFLDWAVPVFTAVFVLVAWLLLSPAVAVTAEALTNGNLLGLIINLFSHQMAGLLLLLLLEIEVAIVVGAWLWYDRPVAVAHHS